MNEPRAPIIAIHRRGGSILRGKHGRCPALPKDRACRVKMLQRRLKAFGLYHGCLDGCYGLRTQKAVLQFQQWAGIPISGKMNPCTWRALFGAQAKLSAQPADFARSLRLECPLMQGRDVWMVQRSLAHQGFLQEDINGWYDLKTSEAVRAFQAAMQIRADGIVGPETWHTLF